MCILKIFRKLFKKPMTKDIRLFINDQEVEFKQTPSILYNWQETDFVNPTVTMNSYTANITVEGTPNNDQIFGSYWNLERYTAPGEGFNPTYRVPFTLYVDGDIYQKGYVKLQKVNVKGAVTSYEISLFGGLGQFLYNLSTDWNTGDKKTLADLKYYGWSTQWPEDEEIDLSFTINKETIGGKVGDSGAWARIDGNYGHIWNQINFAPCYNGLNDKMTNDKAIINFNGLVNKKDLPATSGLTYKGIDGYALATLPQSYTEWETKDLRSWCQRPVISAKAIIKAIQHKENNQGKYDSGYDVILDEEFFNDNNPYYDKAWMTLPLITNLEWNINNGGATAYTSSYSKCYMSGDNNYTYVFNLDEPVSDFGRTASLKFNLGIVAENTTYNRLYTTFRYGSGSYIQVKNAIGIQAYASNSNTTVGPIMSGPSSIAWLGSSIKTGGSGGETITPISYSDCVSKGTYVPLTDSSPVELNDSSFVKSNDGTWYQWEKPISLKLDLPVGATCFKINVQLAGSQGSSAGNPPTGTTTWRKVLAGSYTNNMVTFTVSGLDQKTFTDKAFYINYASQNNFYSNRYISKEQLLSTPFSPAEWLMNYCKMFGLYIHKDKMEDKIYIDTRNTFYNRDNVKNLEEVIDYSQDLNISPIMVDSGYYSMKNESVEGGAYENYKAKYGKEYGSKIIDTGYKFNADTKELIDSPFKSAVQVRDNGAFYFKKSNIITAATSGNTSGYLEPFIYNGLTYDLYGSGFSDTRAITVLQQSVTDNCEPYSEPYPYFDKWDKPEFCKADKSPEDGSYVFLFYAGLVSVSEEYTVVSGRTTITGITYDYMITDDLDIMARLNNNPCWIISDSEHPSGSTDTIAIFPPSMPRFSRMWTGKGNGGQTIYNKSQFAFDWGSPRQLYVPQLYYTDDMTLYRQFYGSYLEDSYDINTKILECYVKTDKVLNEDDLRNFYWFRNGLWRLNKVSDYDVAAHKPVRCQFVKVQDLNDMTNYIPDQRTRILRVTNEDVIDWIGGEYGVNVETNNGGGFIVTDASSGLSFTGLDSQSGKTTEGSFGVVFPRNDDSTAKDYLVTLRAVGDQGNYVRINFTQTRANPYVEISTSPIEVGSGYTSITRTINANIPWTASSPSWVSVYPTTGNGDATLTIGVSNNTGATRSGYIYIRSELETLSVPISQESGANYIIKFTPGNVTDTQHNRWSLYWTVRMAYGNDPDFITVSSGRSTAPHSAGEFDMYAQDAASISYDMPTSAQSITMWYNVVTADANGDPDNPTIYSVFNDYKTYYPGTPIIANQNYQIVMPVVEDGTGHYTQNP